MTENFWKINIDPYDQVIALTQHMINNAIYNLYKRLETGEIVDDAKMPEPAAAYADENNFVEDVVFGPPTVMVKADYSNVRGVELALHLKSGKAQLRKFLGQDPKTKRPLAQVWNVEIDNWVIRVPVDVGFVELNTNTVRGKAVAARSAAKGKPDHSIYELLMDLSSMSLGNAQWELGQWTDDDWLVKNDKDKTSVRPPGWKLGEPRQFTDFEQDFRVTMEYNITKLAPTLQEANLTSLGFAIMAKDANRPATFEVNNTRYMTYPWTDPDTHKTPTPSLDGDARLNYLLYLETVADHTPPDESQPSAILNTRMGNWTDGRKPGIDAPSKFGTFILSSANFMEGYLIPKFSAINRNMSMDIHGVTAWCECNFPYFVYKWSVSASYGLNQGNPKDDQTTFRLTKSTISVAEDWHNDAKDFLRPLTQSPGAGSNVWTYQDVEWGSSAKNAYKHDGCCEVWSYGDTITFTRLYTVAGRNTIVYEGRTWTKFEYKIDPSILDPNVYGGTICRSQWSITLNMTETLDGGMQFVIDYSRPTVKIEPFGKSNMYESHVSWLERMYSAAGSNFDYFVRSVSDSLQGSEKFTLPASGVYYFKNPIIDSRGNLMCELEYNGNPKLDGAINENGDERLQIPQASWNEIPGARTISGSGAGGNK